MIRKLTFVAMAGVAGAALFLALGVWLSEPGWAATRYLFGFSRPSCSSAGPAERERTLSFARSDTFVIDLPASVHFQPGNTAEAVVSGDPTLVAHVRIEDGRLGLDCNPGWFATELSVRLSGPAIEHWKMVGKAKLSLSAISQPRLQLDIDGSGSADADGTVDSLVMHISGSGAARLKGLIAKSTEITIHGSGDVQATATTDADVSIDGSGNVELAGHPVVRHSVIRGKGRIVQLE